MIASESEEASILKLSMQTLKEHYGLNPGKHAKTVRGIGYQLGSELGRGFSSNDLTSLISEIGEYWRKNEIGEMSWESGMLRVNFCSDCIGRSYGVGYTLCPFKEGLLEAVLTTRLGEKYEVREVECCGTQSSGCLFKIETAV